MSLAYLGSLTLSAAVPAGEACAVAGAAGINAALPDIAARLAALAAFSPSPPSFSADLALAGQIITSINAAIALGLTPPSLSAQLAIVAALVADLQAAVLAINAQLAIVVGFSSLLATGGVFGYAYTGAANGLGAALTTQLATGFPGGAPGDSSHALVLATTSGGTWTAMQSVFKTTP